MDESNSQYGGDGLPRTDELGWYYRQRVTESEFTPEVGPEEHVQFGRIIDWNIAPDEFRTWLDNAGDDLLPCPADGCFGMGEPCQECDGVEGHCFMHPHTY